MGVIYKKIGGLWNPEENDELVGRVIDIREDVGDYKSTAYIIETDKSVVQVFGSEVLDDKIGMIEPARNKVIKIIYKGKKKGNKAEYKDYDVFLVVEEEIKENQNYLS